VLCFEVVVWHASALLLFKALACPPESMDASKTARLLSVEGRAMFDASFLAHGATVWWLQSR
jgi:hypothetical protein